MEPRIEIRGCKSSRELHAVVELCNAAFDKTSLEYFERHMFKDETLSFEDSRILVCDGRIVSSVQVFPRTIYIRGKKVPMGGIGNVATLPSERNKGYAGKVMLDAMDYMKQRGFQISLLTTTINEYYERFGFETVRRQLVHMNLIPHTGNPQISVFDCNRDMKGVIGLYDRYNAGSTGPLVRDAAYWQSQLGFCGEDAGLFLVFRDAGEILGYARGRKETASTKILEYAVADGREEIISALFRDLAARTGQPKLDLFVSQAERERLGVLQTEDSEVDTYFMAAFLSGTIDNRVKKAMVDENDFTFWLTDYF